MGDFVFSALAAGLALALLIATARHLFASSSVIMTASPPVAAAVAPALTTAVRPTRPNPAHLAQVTRVAQVPQAVRVAPVAGLAHVASSDSKVARPRAARTRQTLSPRPLPVRRGPSATLVRMVVAKVASRPRAASALVKRATIVNDPPARSRSEHEARATGTHLPATPAAYARSAVAVRLPAHASSPPHARPRRPSPKLILEPPLGYEAFPTLAVLPAAADVDFGTVTAPTVRPQRRR